MSATGGCRLVYHQEIVVRVTGKKTIGGEVRVAKISGKLDTVVTSSNCSGPAQHQTLVYTGALR